MQPVSFERFAGTCAVLNGLAGFLYALAFILIAIRSGFQLDLVSAYLLLLTGLLSSAVLVALYQRLREVDQGFALLALFLGIAGAIGATLHGGYDLANAVNVPVSLLDLPSQADPRGLLTFGLSALAILLLAWLMGRAPTFPRGLSRLGYGLGILLLILYLGRLIVLDSHSRWIVIPALLTGLLASPAWYVWLGLILRRAR